MEQSSPGRCRWSELVGRVGDQIRVLVVDDAPQFAELTARYLEREQDRLSILTETGVGDALDRIGPEAVHCVVSDYDLGQANGIEFLERVRDEHSGLPFILFTSRGSEEVASEAISAGVTDYLQKGGKSGQYELLSNRIVNSVVKQRSQRELDAQRRRLRELHRATRELMAADTRTRAARRASNAARDVLDLPLNGIYFYDADQQLLVPEAVSESVQETIGEPPVIGPGEGVEWRAYETGETRSYSDVRDAPDPIDPETPIRSELHVPLDDHGILIAGSTAPDDFSDADVRSAEILAGNLTASLDRLDRTADRNRERERFQALFDRLTQPVVEATYDDEPIVEQVNEAFEAVFGYERDEVVGEPLDEYVVPEEKRDEAREINRHVQNGGSLDAAEVTRCTADGEREFLLQDASYSDRAGGFVIYTDITERT